MARAITAALSMVLCTSAAVSADTYTVTNTNDSGAGSLRQAITDANGNSGTDTIEFDIAGGGPHTISPASALPTITDPVVIDGYTQTGASANTQSVGSDAVLKIVLDGSGAGGGATGLHITAGSSTVKGLVINGFLNHGIHLQTNGGNTIEGNFIGTDDAGTADVGNGNVGVYIQDAPDNTIGGTDAGARNVISGNADDGIEIADANATGNVVQGNYIGTDANGTAGLGNDGDGVVVFNAADNTIGGTTAGARNVVSGNAYGVNITSNSTGTLLQGNYIGVDANGTAALGNTGEGVYIDDGASDNTIGGTVSGAGNVISGNSVGVIIEGSGTTGNLVQGNFIGTNVNGTADLGNSLFGVYIVDAPDNTVGGTDSAARNVISGNTGGPGVYVTGSTATGNLVQGNYIGTDVNGTADLGNSSAGVWIQDAPDNTVGGTVSGARNIISGNDGFGVYILNSTATGNLVQGNYIGTDVNGTTALGNGDNGVYINGAPDNTVGGTVSGARNVISGNGADGVEITSSEATGNLVQGNYIGTDVDGTAALGNIDDGVSIQDAPDNTVGGTVSGARNIISGNYYGVYISSATGNLVQGNYIGTDVNGTAALGNTSYGVGIDDAPDNTIGGTADGAGNTIAYNGGEGIEVDGTGNALLGNAIFSNTDLGIDLDGDGVTANDADDPDTGPNDLQNFPVLDNAYTLPNGFGVQGSLNSVGGQTYRIEFFSNSAEDPSGYGEGETYLGFTEVTTSSTVNFTTFLPGASVTAGEFITATATDPANNTSEFSATATAQYGLASVSPPAHDLDAAQDADVTATFDDDMNVGDATSFVVHGSMAGKRLSGSYGGDGTTALSFDPTVDFQPGELVTVTLTTDLTSTGALDLGAPYIWQFRAAAGSAGGVFDTETTAADNFDGASSVHAGDIDGDGDLDLLGVAYYSHQVAWFDNTAGDGTTWTETTVDGDGAFDTPRAVLAADIDGDGVLDVLAAASGADDIAWWENDSGDGSTWVETEVDDTFNGANSVDAADMNGDGSLDVLGAASGAGDIAWWANSNGDGSAWSETTVEGALSGAISVQAVDMDGDGDLDVLGAGQNSDEVLWWENTDGEGGAWTEHTVDGAFDGANSVEAADLDGDGDPDVLGAAWVADEVSWWENTAGDGSTWSETAVDASFDGAWYVHAADLDGDGDLDALGAAATDDDIAWWENADGDGSTWTDHTVDDAFDGAYAVHAADIDGDGDLDILGAAQVDDDITWWENAGLATPVLVGLSGATLTDKTPTLDWSDATGATSYTLQYADNAGFTDAIEVTDIGASRYTIPVYLGDATYYWRVKSVDADGLESAYSASDSFVIIPTFGEWTVLLLGLGMVAYWVWYRRPRLPA